MRKVKVSQLFKAIIYIVTLYILGFDKIIALPGSSFSYEIFIGVVCEKQKHFKPKFKNAMRSIIELSKSLFDNYFNRDDVFDGCVWIQFYSAIDSCKKVFLCILCVSDYLYFFYG